MNQIVLIGDSQVGKTCLIHRFIKDEFINEYKPTIYDIHEVSVCLKTKKKKKKNNFANVVLVDTGESVFVEKKIEKAVFSQTKIIFLCFSFDEPKTFENIEKKWLPIIEKYFDRNSSPVQKILVGLKGDLMTSMETIMKLRDKNLLPISVTDAAMMGQKINCLKAFKVSSKSDHDSVLELFDYCNNLFKTLNDKKKAKKLSLKSKRNGKKKSWGHQLFKSKSDIDFGDNFLSDLGERIDDVPGLYNLLDD